MSSEHTRKQSAHRFTLLIGRIFMDHLFQIAIFFTILALTGYILGEELAQWLSIIIASVGLFVLAYLDCWRQAAKQLKKSGEDVSRCERFTGLKAGVISQIPGLILAVIILLPVSSDVPSIIYRWLYIGAFIPIQALAVYFPPAYFIPCAAMILLCWLGWEFGRRQIRIIDHTYYTSGKNRKNIDRM